MVAALSENLKEKDIMESEAGQRMVKCVLMY